MKKPRTKPDVFIIETLNPDDEGNGRFEGSVVSHVLKLHLKNPIYHYVRTREDFEKAVLDFKASKYRYLHISAHGDENGLCTTNDDEISYKDLAKLLTPALKNCRLFLSACSMVHNKMAAEIIPRTGCFSVVGPTEDIGFEHAATIWPAVYHLLFEFDGQRIRRRELEETLNGVSHLFDVPFGYYSTSNGPRGYKRVKLST